MKSTGANGGTSISRVLASMQSEMSLLKRCCNLLINLRPLLFGYLPLSLHKWCYARNFFCFEC